jgi:asparagine synthase (glutamine-hydrolysing)
MLGAIRHRGPDGSGRFVDASAQIALGHRRLAVIDLSPTGTQPMTSGSGRFTIVYNGEIYNYEVLAERLRDDGVGLNGSSDTEVLLEAIDAWGLDATLARVDGMFAFGLWDHSERELTLCRDRFGEKPLVVGRVAGADNAFAFASETRALRAHPGFDDALAPDAVALYLRYKVVPAPFTIHRWARKIEPGSYEVFGADSTWDRPRRMVRYFDRAAELTAASAQPFAGSPGEAVDEAERLLRNSVAARLVADVPLGAFLSGGMDSRVVAALMASVGATPTTFTIGSDDRDYDESALAARSAQALGCDHHELIVTAPQVEAEITGLHALADEPFGDSSLLPTNLVSRLAAGHVTVALSGDGGDEVFGGYERYRWIPAIDARLRRVPRPVATAAIAGLSAVPPAVWNGLGRGRGGKVRLRRLGQKVHKAVTAASIRDPNERELRVLEHWPQAEEIVAEASARADDTGWRAELAVASAGTRMAARDVMGYLPDDILAKVDRAAMHESLETRVPFLHTEVVRFGFSLPAELRFREGTGKWVLRQVLARHLPAELIDTPKAGFGLPIDRWLRGPLRPWAEERLQARALDQLGIDAEPIRRVWGQHLQGTTDHGSELWTVIMLVDWAAHHGYVEL